jgi:hypothetical protein
MLNSRHLNVAGRLVPSSARAHVAREIPKPRSEDVPALNILERFHVEVSTYEAIVCQRFAFVLTTCAWRALRSMI